MFVKLDGMDRVIKGFKPCFKWLLLKIKCFTLISPNEVVDGFKPCFKWLLLKIFECHLLKR